MNGSKKNVVILAAGDFPTHPVPLCALREADFVVCCDSAYCRFSIFNSQFSIPFVVVGDGDSLSESDKRALGDRWVHVDEQDYNDLHKAMAWVMSGKWKAESGEWKAESGKWKAESGEWKVESGKWKAESGKWKAESGKSMDASANSPLSTFHFQLLGATGRREDHTLGNISYLVTFGEEYPGIDLEMLTDHGRFTAFRGCRRFDTFPRQQVSVFSMDPEQQVSGSGLKWPLDGMRIRRWWQATLNEALADSVELRSEGWLVLFRTYDPKV
ncbi:MAG: thiamine pyrophosphokinase [Bacteroidales bacterium]|nr:thiamine pyrophosphokinase [Bacteroidales bacterium]